MYTRNTKLSEKYFRLNSKDEDRHCHELSGIPHEQWRGYNRIISPLDSIASSIASLKISPESTVASARVNHNEGHNESIVKLVKTCDNLKNLKQHSEVCNIVNVADGIVIQCRPKISLRV